MANTDKPCLNSLEEIERRIKEFKKDQADRLNISRFEELFHKAVVPLCFVNKESSTLKFNKQFEKTFAYSQEEVST